LHILPISSTSQSYRSLAVSFSNALIGYSVDWLIVSAFIGRSQLLPFDLSGVQKKIIVVSKERVDVIADVK
jgi:hypothetical protein